MLKNLKSNFLKEIKSHPAIYILLSTILLLSLFVRVYRTQALLGFYFDQGRDAMVVWRLWHEGKTFLIGPTTGIEGIFRGPFYYYLIAPFYLVGGGDPVWPAIFLAVTTVVAIVILYYLGKRIEGRITGLFAVILASFSFNIVLASRWLSNPTPMLLLSLLLLSSVILVIKGKKLAWLSISFLAGLSLFHFGSSGEIFYFLAIAIIVFWQRKRLPAKLVILASIGLILITVAPLVVFDLRHNGILTDNIKLFLINDNSFKLSFWQVISERFEFYYDVFSSKIFPNRGNVENAILFLIAASFMALLPKLIKKVELKVILIFLLSPIIGLVFFQGNFGNIYDYYLTGYYLIFILLFAIVLGRLWRYRLGKLFVAVFFYIFIVDNATLLKARLTDKLDGASTIVLGNELAAVNWVFEDAYTKGQFNVDVYVPPVIPHAYDYLFLWQGTLRQKQGKLACDIELCGLVYEPQLPIVYVLYELDPPHPERLSAWLTKYESSTIVEKEARFGGITVQRRKRI